MRIEFGVDAKPATDADADPQPIRSAVPVRVHADGLDHPEGLAVDRDGSIWAGGEEGQVYRVEQSGTVRLLAQVGGFSGGLAIDRDGSCIVCSTPGRVLRVQPSGSWTVLAETVAGSRMRAPNFPVFGPDGSLYVSDSGSWDSPDGLIYRFERDGTASVFHGGPFAYPNGLAIDAAGTFLYVVRSASHDIVRMRLDEGPAARIEPVCAPGSLRWVPDGIAFGADGTLYATTYGSSRIYRLIPDREVEIVAEDPLGISLNRPTNCAFGGREFSQLFVANLGGRHLSVIDLETPGQRLYGNRA